MRALLIVLPIVLTSVTACGSPPVWRSTEYGLQQPTPTLVVSAVYDYGAPVEFSRSRGLGRGTESYSSADIKAIGDDAISNPLGLLKSAKRRAAGFAAQEVTEGVLLETAPTLHARVVAFLATQGFQAEVDGDRAAKLGSPGEFTYSAPATTARPWRDFPMFGPGSKQSVVDDLKTERAREAYVNIYAAFQAGGHDLDNGATCTLVIKVLGSNAEFVFVGEATGSTGARSGRTPAQVVKAAFDAALAQMNAPVIR